MLNNDDYKRITNTIPLFHNAVPTLAHEVRQAANKLLIPAGTTVFTEGDEVQAIALLLSGVVRVYKIGETGREITLYRFGIGQSCILTATAILNQQSFPALAMVEQDAEVVMIPAQVFREWVRHYDVWRDFVFNLLSQRIMSLMLIVDEVAFQRLDLRVASLLLQRTEHTSILRMTHQEIADEIGSSREVISRVLENFSKQGLIRPARGMIEVLDRVTLQRLM